MQKHVVSRAQKNCPHKTPKGLIPRVSDGTHWYFRTSLRYF